MRVLCAMLIVLVFVVQARASQSASRAAAFAQLKTWYAQGMPIKLQDVDGFYSGRCFAAVRPNVPENVMLGFYTRTIGEDRGPAFPSPKPETKLVTVQGDNLPADYFDDSALFTQNKELLECNLKQAWGRTSSVHQTPTVNWAIDWEGNGRFDESHSLVAYKDYFVETWSALIDQEYGAGWGFHKRGDTLAMCYYFKKMN